MFATLEIGLGYQPCESANLKNKSLPLGDRNRFPGIQKVEIVRCLQNLFVRWQRKPFLDEEFSLLLAVIERFEKQFGIGIFKIVSGHFHFVLSEHVTIAHRPLRAVCPDDIIDAIYIL